MTPKHNYTPVHGDDQQDLAWKDEGTFPPKRESLGVPLRVVIEAVLLVLIVVALSIQVVIRTSERPRGPNDPMKDCESRMPRCDFESDNFDTALRSRFRRYPFYERHQVCK